MGIILSCVYFPAKYLLVNIISNVFKQISCLLAFYSRNSALDLKRYSDLQCYLAIESIMSEQGVVYTDIEVKYSCNDYLSFVGIVALFGSIV